MNAIGVMEISSIAKGIEICDKMIKASQVVVIEALPMCPGKYVIIVGGDVADVEHSMHIAKHEAGSMFVDEILIPNIHKQVFAAVNCGVNIENIKALGIIETYSVASGIKAADAAVKAANVDLIEIRLSRGMGGKSYITMTGNVGDVEAAVASGCEEARRDGALTNYSVIPSPHKDIKRFLY